MGFGSFLSSVLKPKAEAPAAAPANPPTRWEKAVSALTGIVGQVSQIDPNGVDVFCFPGASCNVDVYRNITDSGKILSMVNEKEPGGPCWMGYALSNVMDEAFARGFDKPTSVLVLTAGRPDDHAQLVELITNTAKKVEKDSDITITFVQVGDDQWAESYLKYIDDNLTCQSASGETIDIVDTIKDEEIKAAVGEAEKPGFMGSGGTGGLLGAFAGAALGVGGMYMYNKTQAKKRTEGWNGEWKVSIAGADVATIKVVDDMAGNITMEGWPEDGSAGDATTAGTYADGEGGYSIVRAGAAGGINGTVEDEHNISWSDGTHWTEVPPSAGWAGYAAAGAGGLAAGGAAGFLVQKKFFKKAANKEPSEYVIVVDRSAAMLAVDGGK